MQTEDLFVDVRVNLAGQDNTGLPFSSTRAFAGRFEVIEGGFRWHVELDSDGIVPRSDGAAGVDLSLDDHDPLVMIEDAPGRFREQWIRPVARPAARGVATAQLITVEVGGIHGAVWVDGHGEIAGRIWRGDWVIGVGHHAELPI